MSDSKFNFMNMPPMRVG